MNNIINLHFHYKGCHFLLIYILSYVNVGITVVNSCFVAKTQLNKVATQHMYIQLNMVFNHKIKKVSYK